MKFDVVILGSEKDPHVSSVLSHLNRHGVSSVCLDLVALWSNTVTVQIDQSFLRVGEQEVTSCSVVWNRRANPTIIQGMSAGETRFAQAEFAHAFLGAIHSLEAKWLDPSLSVQHATYKAVQLRYAAQEGRFNLPRTLITSSPCAAIAFISSSEARYVVKPLWRPLIKEANNSYFVYTTLLDEPLHSKIQDVRHSPCVIQEFVERDYDIRLNIIGDFAFATRLESKHIAEAKIDSRRVPTYKEILHTPINPHPEIVSACRQMCRYFGLRFGAFDFAVDRSGRWWFLELNPNGQWYWIEEMTGQALSSAFASEIIRQVAAPSTPVQNG